MKDLQTWSVDRMSRARYVLHVAESWQEFTALKQPWNELHSSCTPGPFVSHVWISAWVDSFGSSFSPRIVYVTCNGVMVAAVAVGINRMRLTSYLKGPTVDCLHMLPNCEGGFIQCLLEPTHEGALCVLLTGLMEKTGNWDLACFEPLLISEVDADVIASRIGVPTTSTVIQRSVTADIHKGWDEYLGSKPRKFRKELRRNAKKISQASANLIYSQEQRPELVARVFALSRSSWKGGAGTAIGGSTARQRFYARIVKYFAATRQIEIYLLEVDGKEAASLLSVRDNGVAYGLKLDFDEKFESLSPSRFLVAAWIKQNAEDKTDHVDLLWDTPFNRTWSGAGYDMQRLQVFPRYNIAAMLCKAEVMLRPLGRNWRRMKRQRASQRAGHRSQIW